MSKHLSCQTNPVFETKAATDNERAQKLRRCQAIKNELNGLFQALTPFQEGIRKRSEFIVAQSSQWTSILIRAYGEAAAEVLAEIALAIPKIRAARAAGGILRNLDRVSNSIGGLTGTVGKTANAQRSARAIKLQVDNAKKDVELFLNRITRLNHKISRLQEESKRLRCPR